MYFERKWSEIPGILITTNSKKIDKEIISSILSIDTPKSKEGLQRFLGMMTYIANFIQNLWQETDLLRDLLKENSILVWTTNNDEVFKRFQNVVNISTCFKVVRSKWIHNNIQHGLGAALIQGNQPVAFASKSLMSAEKNYVPNEKELLLIVFAVERLHQFVYGQHFYSWYDHKPLKCILNKPLANAPIQTTEVCIWIRVGTWKTNEHSRCIVTSTSPS